MTAPKRYTDEEKALAVELAEEGATMTDLMTRFGAARITVKNWLDAAGVEPGRKRAPKRDPDKERARGTKGQSLRNTPLALKLEENVRRRCEGRTDLLR